MEYQGWFNLAYRDLFGVFARRFGDVFDCLLTLRFALVAHYVTVSTRARTISQPHSRFDCKTGSTTSSHFSALYHRSDAVDVDLPLENSGTTSQCCSYDFLCCRRVTLHQDYRASVTSAVKIALICQPRMLYLRVNIRLLIRGLLASGRACFNVSAFRTPKMVILCQQSQGGGDAEKRRGCYFCTSSAHTYRFTIPNCHASPHPPA